MPSSARVGPAAMPPASHRTVRGRWRREVGALPHRQDLHVASAMSSAGAIAILEPPDRIVLPEPLGTVRPSRYETQRWQRLGRAEGELVLGWSADGALVRIEYHWIRRLSLADPSVADIYTAELWAQRPTGEWAYMLLPGEPRLHAVQHERLRPLLLRQLAVDIGDPLSAGVESAP